MLSWLSPLVRRPESMRENEGKVETSGDRAEKKAALFTDAPLDAEVVAKRTARRVPYFEIREAGDLEKREMKEIKKIVGKEIRDLCRESLDDYVDCMVERTFTFLRCRSLAWEARKCISKYETPEWLEPRYEALRREREEKGLSLMRRQERHRYNKFISPSEGTGWLPSSEGQEGCVAEGKVP